MMNTNFTAYSESKKRSKLKTVLKSKTRNYLTGKELETVVEAVKLTRQYAIKLYFNVIDFNKAIKSPKVCGGEFILGKLQGETLNEIKDVEKPAVAIVRSRNGFIENQLLIFVPKQRQHRIAKKQEKSMVLCVQDCIREKYICEHIVYGEKSLYCGLEHPKEVTRA